MFLKSCFLLFFFLLCNSSFTTTVLFISSNLSFLAALETGASTSWRRWGEISSLHSSFIFITWFCLRVLGIVPLSHQLVLLNTWRNSECITIQSLLFILKVLKTHLPPIKERNYYISQDLSIIHFHIELSNAATLFPIKPSVSRNRRIHSSWLPLRLSMTSFRYWSFAVCF